MKKRFVVLEDMIPYDWDDYDLWGVVAYDSKEDKIVKDKYGHGTDWADRLDSFPLKECSDEEKMIIKRCLVERYCHAERLFEWGRSWSGCNLPVKVVRGRKMKGKQGTCMSVIYEENTYMKRQYPWRKWGDYYASVKFEDVIDPISIRSCYLELADKDDVNAKLKEKMVANDEVTIGQLAHICAYEMSYSSCDTESAKVEPLKAMKKCLPL